MQSGQGQQPGQPSQRGRKSTDSSRSRNQPLNGSQPGYYPSSSSPYYPPGAYPSGPPQKQRSKSSSSSVRTYSGSSAMPSMPLMGAGMNMTNQMPMSPGIYTHAPPMPMAPGIHSHAPPMPMAPPGMNKVPMGPPGMNMMPMGPPGMNMTSQMPMSPMIMSPSSQAPSPRYYDSPSVNINMGTTSRHNLTFKRPIRNIPLTAAGNLVIDVPVPERVLSMGKMNQGEEFTHMRYTAITCKPDDVSLRGYSLRQQEYARVTELFIVVTMYNEPDDLFCKSICALQKNIAYLCSRTRSKTWGEEGWKKVVICIVSDGRAKVNSRVLDVLGILGVYQEGIMKDHVNDKSVTAHVFEYTTQVAVTTDLKVQGHQKGFVPVQILFCLKEKNAKKINSHRWFFNAFGPLIRPNICVLIDCGTKPTQTSLYHLWKTFDREPYVGGACGEIYCELGNGCSKLLNPLVAARTSF